MIRVGLSTEQREELRTRTHERGVDPHTRDRLKMLRLADASWPTSAKTPSSKQPKRQSWRFSRRPAWAGYLSFEPDRTLEKPAAEYRGRSGSVPTR
jgi:hypothetical protein